VGVSKSLNRLAILGILACGGAWAQSVVGVQVGLSEPGPYFLVDGQPYNTPQIFQWQVGSVHQIYFVQSVESDGSLGNHQYPSTSPGTRYTFSTWEMTGQTPPGTDPLLVFTVSPTLTKIVGDVITEVQLYVYFGGFTDPTLACSTAAIPNDPRQGVVMVGSTCFSAPSTIWITPGSVSISAAAFPGYIFTNWLVNGNVVTGQSISAFPIVMPSNLEAVFVPAKRVRIRSNPLGLSIVVDNQLIKPGPIFSTAFSGDPYCPVNFALLPIGFPVGYVPLCVGDFDFLPGSQHLLAAPAVQADSSGKTWVFTGFSNGMGQNAVYTADSNTSVPDILAANFVAAVPTNVVTSPAGLTVNIDGQNDSTGSQLLWAVGQTHHLIAPATQTDSTGRPWQFSGWSNGGPADQNYTVPSGLLGLVLTATYQPVGKLQVVSVPPGLPFMVDGAACTTPCVLLTKPTGAQVQVVAPATATPDAFSRYNFVSWDSGSTSTTTQVTITDQAQVIVATYQGFFKLSASSSPADHVTFTFGPSSPDGFFAAGTLVNIVATPYNGFTFKRWSGDLSGTSLSGTVMMNAPRSVVAVLDGFPFISDNGVRNAAGPTPTGTVGPGSDISIYGDDLAATTLSSPPGQLAQSLGDVWVTVNDRLLPLLYISPNVINAQLFSDLPDGNYTLTVHRTAQMDASGSFTVKRDSPGLFQWYSPQGSTVAAFHADGTILNAASPATQNETITILGTGFGFYDKPLVDGFPTPATGVWNVLDPVTVTAGGQTYTPISSRAANSQTGMVVVQVKLTGTLPSGLDDLKVTVNSVDSNTVKLPVQ